MAKPKKQFYCTECGAHSPAWLGKCPQCGEWNTLVEQLDSVESKHDRFKVGTSQKPIKINSVKGKQRPRIVTSFEEFNRTLGGGIVYGSLVLIGGDPGIGKSTLLLQIAFDNSKQSKKVLYISGEESSEQIKLRADRVGEAPDNLFVYCETDVTQISHTIQQSKPDIVIIDSIQTIYNPEISSMPGNVSQVRECTMTFLKLAKTLNIPIFIVGHVTKEGNIAGPRLLEHMVDTVLYFEGEQHNTYRILRSVKNRFGSTNEIGIFEMREEGLKEIANPSQVFLEDRVTGVSGSCVVASVEGTRPVLVEIQSLITPTNLNNAKRMASGVDNQRMALILAIIEKKLGHLLQSQDAYIKVTGGVRLFEPAIDLAILVSILSSYLNKPVNHDDVFIGEVGLSGEVRRVSQIEKRVKEAQKLGFKRAFIPHKNMDQLKKITEIKLIPISNIKDLDSKIFSNYKKQKSKDQLPF